MHARPKHLVAAAGITAVAAAATALVVGEVLPVVAIGMVAFAISMAAGVLIGDRGRRALRYTFPSLPPSLIARILASEERPNPTGEERTVSILVALVDVPRVEEHPTQRIAILDRSISAMAGIVHRHGGVIVSADGAKLVALFGWPVIEAGHAASAASAAVDMRDLEPPLRIGIQSGTTLVGRLRRSGYVALGDTVTFAAQLAATAQRYGTRVLVGEEAAQSAAAGILFREVDIVPIPGRDTPMALLEPIETQEMATDADRAKASAYAAAFHYWRRGRFAEAEAAFRDLAGDPAAAALAERAGELAANSPEEWDGASEPAEK